jgi:predicted ATP-grasp superfamily ATP-dependent carboligase
MVAAVVRDKQADKTQQLSSTHPVLDLARQVLALFGCDGLVNLQTKGDAQGVQHVLEINARPSGGVSYTEHLGINLAALTLGRRLGWTLPPSQVLAHAWVRPITTSVHIHPQKDLDICN